MAALTPAKPSFYDGTWCSKIRVWLLPVYDTGTNTVTVPGVKKVFSFVPSKTGVCTWTTTMAANGLGVTVTFTVSASATGGYAPLVVYGQ